MHSFRVVSGPDARVASRPTPPFPPGSMEWSPSYGRRSPGPLPAPPGGAASQCRPGGYTLPQVSG